MTWAVCNSAHRARTLSRICIGSLKLANNVGNIKTSESFKKDRKHFASRRKGSPTLWPGNCLDYTSILEYFLGEFIISNHNHGKEWIFRIEMVIVKGFREKNGLEMCFLKDLFIFLFISTRILANDSK